MKKIAVLTSGWAVDYVLAFIQGLQEQCLLYNAELFIFTCYKYIEPSGEENITSFKVFDLIDFESYDGIVITPNLFNDDKMIEKYAQKIRDSKVPAVSVGKQIEGLKYVSTNNLPAIKEAVGHLIQEHHAKTFAFVGGPTDNNDAVNNERNCKNFVKDFGLDPKTAFIYTSHTDWSYNSGYEQAKIMFKKLKTNPDAIICINHSAAMSTIKCAVENGIHIPNDISLISLDDCMLSTKVIPSVSSVNLNAIQSAKDCIDLLLKDTDVSERVTPALFMNRQSCGCNQDVSREQVIYTQGFVKELEIEQRFTSQLRFLETRFLKGKSMYEVQDDLQHYYESRHFFEGPDFAICIDKDIMENISDPLLNKKHYTSYGKTMETLTNIQNGKPAALYTLKTSQIIPQNMKGKKPAMYLIFPVFVQKTIYGYYVAKNFTGLLQNKAAYNWTRNIGTSIEKFRQTSIYRRMSEQLQVLSTQDSLSGLLNRAGLHSYGVDLFENNSNTNQQTEIIFVDINNMKIINDKFGHLQGDLAIKTVAEVIRNSIPDGYIAVRYGGDEFVIIGKADTENNTCQKINRKLKSKVSQMSLPYTLTASVGSRVFEPKEVPDLQIAISIVDKIMYLKKQKYHSKHN